MRVIRRRGQFGTKIEVAGIAPDRKRAPTLPSAAIQEIGRAMDEPAPVILARLLERRIGRGGGLRDTTGFSRDRYHTFAVDRLVEAWIKKQADARGLARGAFVGMIIEAVKEMSGADLDDLLAGERSLTESHITAVK